jgi:hypothetical protein
MVFTRPHLLHFHYHCHILSAIGCYLCTILFLDLVIFTFISRLGFFFHGKINHCLRILLAICLYDLPMSEVIDCRVECLPAIHDLEAFRIAIISIYFATINAELGIDCLRESPR